MIISEASARPSAAGVFVVRDPDVCAALEALLQPHYTGPPPAILQTAPSGTAVLAAATAHATELLAKPSGFFDEYTEVAPILDLIYAEALRTGRQEASTEGREWSEHQTGLVSSLEKQVEELQDDLTEAVKKLEQARTEATDLLEAKVDLETNLAQAEHRITGLERDLAKAQAAPPAAPKPVDARTTRGKDRNAFADLADRMDREAMSQNKTVASVLRTAANSVRQEIEMVYGTGKRKAS